MAAFIIKGKSFPTVRPKHVSHQIFRLESIPDLRFAFLVAPGQVLDDVKVQFVSTAKRLRCDYAIADSDDLGRLFVAYGFLCPRDGTRVTGGRCGCGYSPDFRTSNLLQLEALKGLEKSHARKEKAAAVVLPTGAGKTRVAAHDVQQADPILCLYVAHSHEILEDAESEFLTVFPSQDLARFDSRPTKEKLQKINLLTIQTLSRNVGIFANGAVDYMIIDEFHHAAAKSYRYAIDVLKPKFLLGLTATPFRGDRIDVLNICQQNVVVNYELRHGIEMGILSPYHYYGCFDNIDYSNIKHNGIRYNVKDLERALVVPERDAAILAKWREKADGKPTLAFCCSQLHADRVARAFNREGISAATYLSTTSREARPKIRERFRQGDIKVLCAVDILNEGVDLPFAECLLFLRPTESKRIFLQQLGRGLRHYVGKRNCIIIDFIGNFKNASKIIEYQTLDASGESDSQVEVAFGRTLKDIIDAPIGCVVEFDDKVIDIFGNQTYNPAFATRYNIANILIYQHQRLQRKIGRQPTKIDIDRHCLLDSSFYKSVFGSWDEFELKVEQAPELF